MSERLKKAELLAREVVKDSIVMQATERLVYQIVEACAEHERAQLAAKDEEIARLREALEPFATFGLSPDGDIRDGLMRDRICDWFGPSEFDAVRAALNGKP